jgi:hypothetical protein
MKKSMLIIMGAAAAYLVAGCSSPPVALAPVGPSPIGFSTGTANGQGQLQVFLALSDRNEGDNPSWSQHSDYSIYDSRGKLLEHVDNAMGYYSQTPRVVTLPPGQYMVKARAKGILRAEVPVVIKSGQMTGLHLDGNWHPMEDTPQTGLVKAPAGYPIGWNADEVK